MAHRLLGKDVDDILVEFDGPQTGRNYFADTVVPQLSIQMFGADALDAVVLEKNTTLGFVGTNNSNAIGSKPVRGGKLLPTRDAGDWGAIGAPILVSSGLVVLVLAAEDFRNGLRIRITVKTLGSEGDGSVEVATQWN